MVTTGAVTWDWVIVPLVPGTDTFAYNSDENYCGNEHIFGELPVSRQRIHI